MTVVQPTTSSILDAATTLHDGGVIAFATETVYGLGCDTFNTTAIERVYTLKGRPVDNPMIAHVLHKSTVPQLSDRWGKECDLLADMFWPGALTIVVPRRSTVPPSACGGFDTIAIRCPSHPVARQLLEVFDGPISAPSANRSGYISPTTAAHVESEFQGSVTILDGGSCEHGIESTVVSMVDEPALLRPGSIPIEDVEECIGSVHQKNTILQVDSPGTSCKHYAPHCTTRILTTQEMQSLDDDRCVAIVLNASPKQTRHTFHMPSNPPEYAAKLYAVLRDADAQEATMIVIERPPDASKWRAIHDRLTRCAH